MSEHYRWISHCRLFMHISLKFFLSLTASVLQRWPAPLTYNHRLSRTSQVMWELCVHLLCSNCSFTEASFTMHNLSLASTHPSSVPSLGPSLLCWPTFLLTCLCRRLSTPIKPEQDKEMLLLLSSSLGNVTLSVLDRYCGIAKTYNTLSTVYGNKEGTLWFSVFYYVEERHWHIHLNLLLFWGHTRTCFLFKL